MFSRTILKRVRAHFYRNMLEFYNIAMGVFDAFNKFIFLFCLYYIISNTYITIKLSKGGYDYVLDMELKKTSWSYITPNMQP